MPLVEMLGKFVALLLDVDVLGMLDAFGSVVMPIPLQQVKIGSLRVLLILRSG